MRRKRFSRHQRQPSFNRLTMNVEFARALGEGDGLTPTRTVDEPSHVGQGGQWQSRDDDARAGATTGSTPTAANATAGMHTDGTPDEQQRLRDIAPEPFH